MIFKFRLLVKISFENINQQPQQQQLQDQVETYNEQGAIGEQTDYIVINEDEVRMIRFVFVFVSV